MKTILAIKTDATLRDTARETAAQLGITLTTAVNAFLKQFVRDKEIILSARPRMTPYLENIIGEANRDLAAGKNISPRFRSAEKAIEYLDAL